MWNDLNTAHIPGVIGESIEIAGHEGKNIHAYFARPTEPGNYPGIVLIPHMPGWDEWCFETSRRFAQHGYQVLCPNIYEDFGHGAPPEVSMRMREQGMVTDASVMADAKASLDCLRAGDDSNGKVGVIGMCSGGRHAYLAACTLDFDAAVDCWGGGVIQAETNEARPVSPIDLTESMSCPLLGIFGNDDRMPTPEEVNKTEEVLKKFGKDYTFFRYDGAGHGFWYYDRPMYRQEQAMDSLEKVYEFFEQHLRE